MHPREHSVPTRQSADFVHLCCVPSSAGERLAIGRGEKRGCLHVHFPVPLFKATHRLIAQQSTRYLLLHLSYGVLVALCQAEIGVHLAEQNRWLSCVQISDERYEFIEGSPDDRRPRGVQGM